MSKITILPFGETVELRENETVRNALHRIGLEFETPCNGKGICGQCRIWVENPENVPETPHEKITPEESARGVRLACQLVLKTDVTIRIPEGIISDTRRIMKDGGLPLFSSTVEEENQSYKARSSGIERVVEVYRQDEAFWLRYDSEPEPKRLYGWDSRYSPLGLAIDLGTTTVVVALVSLLNGKELATASVMNPQIRYGHDVMSRIHHGSSPEGLEELAAAVRKAVNRLVKDICADSQVSPHQVLDIVVGGNTTMLELAAKIDPQPLGRRPFTATIVGGKSYPMEQFGFEANPAARVYIPPVVHAFVGGDVSAGLLVSSGFFEGPGAILFIDAGTNGELGLSANGMLVVTSTAAGPAFEGMGISCGMRVGVGAIEAVFAEGTSILFGTVGNAPAKGICGSGIIDLVASLLQMGVIERTGRMKRPRNSEGLPESIASCLEEVEGQATYKLADGVRFTQEDVRQVQLAKGAIRAAIDMFLQETGTSSEEIQRIVLAGGFGYSLRPESLEIIGMIPPNMADKVTFAGNTSLLGCVKLLGSVSERRFIEDRMSQVEHIALAERPEFMEYYVENMRFPSQ
ncbi:MAG: ASKHA domain-containing protein [Dehalococcoidia bacterium]